MVYTCNLEDNGEILAAIKGMLLRAVLQSLDDMFKTP